MLIFLHFSQRGGFFGFSQRCGQLLFCVFFFLILEMSSLYIYSIYIYIYIYIYILFGFSSLFLSFFSAAIFDCFRFEINHVLLEYLCRGFQGTEFFFSGTSYSGSFPGTECGADMPCWSLGWNPGADVLWRSPRTTALVFSHQICYYVGHSTKFNTIVCRRTTKCLICLHGTKCSTIVGRGFSGSNPLYGCTVVFFTKSFYG